MDAKPLTNFVTVIDALCHPRKSLDMDRKKELHEHPPKRCIAPILRPSTAKDLSLTTGLNATDHTVTTRVETKACSFVAPRVSQPATTHHPHAHGSGLDVAAPCRTGSLEKQGVSPR